MNKWYICNPNSAKIKKCEGWILGIAEVLMTCFVGLEGRSLL